MSLVSVISSGVRLLEDVDRNPLAWDMEVYQVCFARYHDEACRIIHALAQPPAAKSVALHHRHQRRRFEIGPMLQSMTRYISAPLNLAAPIWP